VAFACPMGTGVGISGTELMRPVLAALRAEGGLELTDEEVAEKVDLKPFQLTAYERNLISQMRLQVKRENSDT
jgi:hypothetical protein